MNWKYTVVLHDVRKALGLTTIQYMVFDLIYKSQTHPDHNINGWADTTYQDIAKSFQISKGMAHKTISYGFERGFVDVDPTNSRRKKTTSIWYDYAYLKELTPEKMREILLKTGSKRSQYEHLRSQYEFACSQYEHFRSQCEHIKEIIKDLNKNNKDLCQNGSFDDGFEIGGIINDLNDHEKEFVISEKILKEKSSAKKEKDKRDILILKAVEVINFLNELSGRDFKTDYNGRGKNNIDLVLKLFRKKYSNDEIKLMIQFKAWEWTGTKQEKYLQPSTLFGSKFLNYLNNAEEAKNNPSFVDTLKKSKLTSNEKNNSISKDAAFDAVNDILTNGI